MYTQSKALLSILTSVWLISCSYGREIPSRRLNLPQDYHKDESTRHTLEIDSRIVNGVEAELGDYPWFAHIPGCGGSLISSEFILTAAHCVGAFAERDKLRIGAYCNVDFDGSMAPGCEEDSEIMTYNTIFAHPEYDAKSFSHDFALIKLNGQAKTEPVEIDQGYLSPSYDDGKKLWVLGLGLLESYSGEGPYKIPDKLMHVELSYINNDKCSEMYATGGLKGVDDSMMCAADPKEDACQGDSGGPLYDAENKTLVGAVSFGIGCASPLYPGVYARIAEEFPWIQYHVCVFHEDESTKPSWCQGYSIPPTISPTASPTFSSFCEADEISFRFEFGTDLYPIDNTWDVTNSAGEVVVKGERYNEKFTEYTYKECLEPADCYKFTFVDSFGDGLGAVDSTGKFDPGFSLFVSNANSSVYELLIEDDGGPYNSKTTTFGEMCTTASPTQSPSASPAQVTSPPTIEKICHDPENIIVILEIGTDIYPYETSWEIADTTGKVVKNGGGYTAMLSSFVEKLCLNPGCYEFTIKDSIGDGFAQSDPAFNSGYKLYVDTGSGKDLIAEADSMVLFASQTTPFGSCVIDTPTAAPTINRTSDGDTVLCPGQDPDNYCDCSYDCTGNPLFCSCEEAVTCCSGSEPLFPTKSPSMPPTIVGIPDGAVLCPGQDPDNYCDCGYDDCTDNPLFCSCEEAVTCCSGSKPFFPTKSPSMPPTIVGIPDGTVLCPGQDPDNYCDCGYDCTGNPLFCSCEEAVTCCSGSEPLFPTKSPSMPPTIVGIPDGTVLCPGQDPDNYCDCGYDDCTGNPLFCSCEEAVACCSDTPPKPTPPPPLGCDGSDIIKVVLEINTDSHPMDTSWRIESPGPEIGGGGYTEVFTKYVENICLDPGCHEFYILDSYGDGFTVTHSGYEVGYKLYADVNDGSGLVLLAEADGTVKFTSNLTFIGSCDVSTPPPTLSPTMNPTEQPTESLTLAPTIKAEGDYFQITSTFPSSTKWCVQPKSLKEGSRIVIGKCDKSDIQQWSADEYGRIQPKTMKYMCITKAPFDRLTLEYCGSATDSTMFMYNTFENTLVWKDACLTISSYSPEDGDDVILAKRDRALLVQEWLIK